MGYRILIGNAVETPDGPAIEQLHLDDAPAFPGDDDCHHLNERAESYTAWANFAEATGLHGMFFHPDHGLLTQHPGLAPITPAHVEEVQRALQRQVKSGRGQMPGFGVGLDYTAARLLWLDWWMRWAVKNCESPAIQNS